MIPPEPEDFRGPLSRHYNRRSLQHQEDMKRYEQQTTRWFGDVLIVVSPGLAYQGTQQSTLGVAGTKGTHLRNDCCDMTRGVWSFWLRLWKRHQSRRFAARGFPANSYPKTKRLPLAPDFFNLQVFHAEKSFPRIAVPSGRRRSSNANPLVL